jgi:hypothetical protein
MNRFAALLAVATLFSAGAVAQDTAFVSQNQSNQNQGSQNPGQQKKTFFFSQSDKMPANIEFHGNMGDDVAVMGAEMVSPGETVTGVPYTATEVTETTQTLSDGNKIVNKTSGTVARDSQGRVRREMSVGRIGAAGASNHKMLFISDPTAHHGMGAGAGSGTDTATVISTTGDSNSDPQIITFNRAGSTMVNKKVMVRTSKDASSDESNESDKKQVKHEDLGTQTVAGVSAQGKRDTITIPAGEIGNEKPIEVVSETWYSPDLHATVMRKHSDPRTGETVFQLTDIKRAEPDPALFQLPEGVKVIQDHPRHAAPKE